MKPPNPPRFETRRAKELETELFERARAWIPSWSADEDDRDFGHALLKIAARFGSEVAERLDRAGEKLRLGFLDWLAVPTAAARPARLPVVFKLTDRAREAKPAASSTRLQVEAAGISVILETETELLLLPRGLQVLVGVDGAADAFFLPPPGLSSLVPLEPLPTQWQLKSFASNGATKLQLDPVLGLVAGMLIELGGQQYKVMQVNKDIVALDPPLSADFVERSVATKVTAFMPYDDQARSAQGHALYLGHTELFDIESAATIEILGEKSLANMSWHYSGRRSPDGPVEWLELPLAGSTEQADSVGVVLKKPKDKVEMLELVPGTQSRWLRASIDKLAPDHASILIDTFEIRINCVHDKPFPSCTEPLVTVPSTEAMANTTPLVLDNVFFPFGKEPRQFDAFYLGSQEAFSKKGAEVQLCFEMADPNFSSLTSLRSGSQADLFLGGVAADGHLHLFQFLPSTVVLTRLPDRVPLRPPIPAEEDALTPQDNLLIALDPKPTYRVPIWSKDTIISVAVAAKGAVWVWHENLPTPNLSGWLSLGVVGPLADTAKQIEGLVYLAGGPSGLLLALRDTKLFVRDPSMKTAQWEEIEIKETGSGKDVKLAKIAPICVENTGDLGNGLFTEGLIGITTSNELFGITLVESASGQKSQGICKKLLGEVATTVAPVAVRRKDDCLVAVALDNRVPPNLVAFRSKPTNFNLDVQDKVPLNSQSVIGGLLDMNFNANVLTVAVSVKDAPESTALASWVPFAAADLKELFKVQTPATHGVASGAPTLISQHVLVPTSTSQVIVAEFNLSRRVEIHESLSTAIIAVDALDRFSIGDRLAIPIGVVDGVAKYQLQGVDAAGVEFRGKALYEFNLEAIEKPLFVYRATAPVLTGGINPMALDTIEIAAQVPMPDNGDVLLITTDVSTQLYVVQKCKSGTRIAELDRNLDVVNPTPTSTVNYVAPQTSQAIIRPMLHLNPETTGKWQASVLDRVSLFFPGADPELQPATVYQILDERPELVVLGQHWRHKPTVVSGAGVKFIVDGTVGKWVAQLGDSSTNPELSWEYWNGRGWWTLNAADETLYLQRRGAVRFEVPADIASADWSGRANYWIRARLIGGDYGREKVSVEIEPPDQATNIQKQTIVRSTAGIRAPSVVKLQISYGICKRVRPTFVLTKDSGSIRDQSDANRTPGAKVEAFVPLALLLGRLSDPAAAVATAGDGEPDCDCLGTTANIGRAAALSAASFSPAVGSTEALAPSLTLGRALYLGFDAPLLGEPINVLLLVEERRHDEFAPMTVEALIADRFEPVIVNDATRALGESGVLSLALPVAPTPRELFGQTLSWLRLIPAAGHSSESWKPKVLGAYLNGVWASAAETLTRELVGSSQGEPNLTLYLARPPVLHNSLELRVNEPLGEEEIDELNTERADRVLTAVENLPGNWVLWKQVIDPGDETSTARVYALDEATGEIRFGDGRYGKIPPVGGDSIMAFTYRRTVPGAPDSSVVPGNAITARTPLNLVSPIDGVEAVFAADQAAGGAAPENIDRVLRFGVASLRHRERALTERDIEDLALESSPDIAQAHCFPRQGFVQIVVVMRDANPTPNVAQKRELHRLLAAVAPPALSARRALRIDGPTLRWLRVDLRLCVASLEVAGAVGRHVRQQVMALFDASTGGVTGDGWMLGENPSEADIAVALANIPHLESIAAVVLREIAADGGDHAWTQSIKCNELARLDKDGVRIEFETIEGVA